MQRFLVATVVCGALTSFAAVGQADDDWWEDWEDAVEDARDDAEDAWEHGHRPGVGHTSHWQPRRSPYPAHYGQGYGHLHYYSYEPRPAVGVFPPCVWIPVPTLPPQAGPPHGGMWLEDVAWYRSDAPAPRPVSVFVPPAPAESDQVYTSTEAVPAPIFSGDPLWPSDTPSRLEPIPDEHFQRRR